MMPRAPDPFHRTALSLIGAAPRLPPEIPVAASGMRVQSYARNGRFCSHITSSDTRAPAVDPLRSVVEVAEDTMTAIGWANVLRTVGDAAGPELPVTHNIVTQFQFQDEGAVRQNRTVPIAEMIL